MVPAGEAVGRPEQAEGWRSEAQPAVKEGGPPGSPGVMLGLSERPLGRGKLVSILSWPKRCEQPCVEWWARGRVWAPRTKGDFPGGKEPPPLEQHFEEDTREEAPGESSAQPGRRALLARAGRPPVAAVETGQGRHVTNGASAVTARVLVLRSVP